MSYLLHIDATSFTSESYSRQVAGSFRDGWDGEVVHRDLAANPVPHLTAAGISARFTDPILHTDEQIDAAAVQNELIDEFIGAGATCTPCRSTTTASRRRSKPGSTR